MVNVPVPGFGAVLDTIGEPNEFIRVGFGNVWASGRAEFAGDMNVWAALEFGGEFPDVHVNIVVIDLIADNLA